MVEIKVGSWWVRGIFISKSSCASMLSSKIRNKMKRKQIGACAEVCLTV